MGQIDDTFGALYIGGTIGMVMYGIFILQTYFYFIHYNNEKSIIKLLVICVFILDTTHSIFVAHSNYFYLVSGFTHPGNFRAGVWSLYASTAANVLLSLFVKSYYIMQIHQLSKPVWRRWITPFLVTLTLLHFGSGVETVAAFFVKGKLSQLLTTRTSSLILLSSNLATDFIIATFLCVVLRKRRLDFPESRVNSIINTLIIFCVQRFILCFVVGVIQLAFLMTRPNTLYTAAVGITFGKLYSNSLLATLNSRRYIGATGGRKGESTMSGDTTRSFPSENAIPRQAVITTIRLDTGDTRSTDDVDRFSFPTDDLEGSIASCKN